MIETLEDKIIQLVNKSLNVLERKYGFLGDDTEIAFSLSINVIYNRDDYYSHYINNGDNSNFRHININIMSKEGFSLLDKKEISKYTHYVGDQVSESKMRVDIPKYNFYFKLKQKSVINFLDKGADDSYFIKNISNFKKHMGILDRLKELKNNDNISFEYNFPQVLIMGNYNINIDKSKMSKKINK